MSRFKNVLVFEYLNIVKSKSFLGTMIFFSIICIVVALLPLIIPTFIGIMDNNWGSSSGSSNTGSSNTKNVAFINSAGMFNNETLSEYFPEYEWTEYNLSQIDIVKEHVDDRTIEFAINFIDELQYEIIVRNSVNQQSSRQFNEMMVTIYQSNVLETEGVDAQLIGEILNVQAHETRTIVGSGGFWLGYAVLLVLFFPLVAFGSSISMSVVNEKTSKTVELLLTSAKPTHIIFGKVFGVGLVVVTQVAILAGVFIITLILSDSVFLQLFPPQILLVLTDPFMYIYIFVLFTLSFLTFAFLFAGFASTVRDIQESTTVTAIPTMLCIAGLYIGLFALQNEIGSTFVSMVSFIPFISPQIMIGRICTTLVPFHEIILSIVINVLTLILTGVASSRIYRACILMHGQKISFGKLFLFAIKGNNDFTR